MEQYHHCNQTFRLNINEPHLYMLFIPLFSIKTTSFIIIGYTCYLRIINTMITNDEQPFKQRLIKLLGKKNFKKHSIVSTIVSILNKTNEKELLKFLKNYLSINVNSYNKDSIVNKIIELTFDELIVLAGNNLEAIKDLYGLFNILSIQKLSQNSQILHNLYKTLPLQDAYGCSGLHLILTRHKDKLLKTLINLAKDNPERITELYSALPIQNKYKQSALNILCKEPQQTSLNHIKNLIKKSHFQKLIHVFMPKKRIINNTLNEMQSYYLYCLSTDSKSPIIPGPLDNHTHAGFLEWSDSHEHLNPQEQQPSDFSKPPQPEFSESYEQNHHERQHPDTQESPDEQQYSSSSSTEHSDNTGSVENIESLEKQLSSMEITTVPTLNNTITDYYKAHFTSRSLDEIDPPTLSNAISNDIQTSLSSIDTELPSLPGSITTSPSSTKSSPQHKTLNVSPKHSQQQNPLSLLRIGPLL